MRRRTGSRSISWPATAASMPPVGPVVEPGEQAVAALREQPPRRRWIQAGIGGGVDQRAPAPAVEGRVQQRGLQDAILERAALVQGIAHCAVSVPLQPRRELGQLAGEGKLAQIGHPHRIQDAVEVIHLVLQHPGEQAVGDALRPAAPARSSAR